MKRQDMGWGGEKPATYPGFRITSPDPGIEGLDELAAELGVEPDNDGITLEGKSGKLYGLVDLLMAHLKEMRRSKGDV